MLIVSRILLARHSPVGISCCFRQADMTLRKLNTSPATLEEKEVLKKYLTTPPVKKIDLHFPLGLEVTARNLKGVTIKDALDAIHKQFKKKVYLDCPTSEVLKEMTRTNRDGIIARR